LGDWFPSNTYLLTSKASPNDSGIVIIVIVIIIGEVDLLEHRDANYSTEWKVVTGDSAAPNQGTITCC
jgi:hypothetical protein